MLHLPWKSHDRDLVPRYIPTRFELDPRRVVYIRMLTCPVDHDLQLARHVHVHTQWATFPFRELDWNPVPMDLSTKFDRDPRRILQMRAVTGLHLGMDGQSDYIVWQYIYFTFVERGSLNTSVPTTCDILIDYDRYECKFDTAYVHDNKFNSTF